VCLSMVMRSTLIMGFIPFRCWQVGSSFGAAAGGGTGGCGELLWALLGLGRFKVWCPHARLQWAFAQHISIWSLAEALPTK